MRLAARLVAPRRFAAAWLTMCFTLPPGLALAAPSEAERLTAAAEALLAQKKWPEAIGELHRAVAADPSYALAWYDLAYAQRRSGDCASAIAAYQRFATLRPAEPDPYYGLGLCKKQLGDPAGAIAALRQYISAEKRPSEAKFVEKARAEIALLESSMAAGAAPSAPPAPVPAAAPAPSAMAFRTAPAAPPLPTPAAPAAAAAVAAAAPAPRATGAPILAFPAAPASAAPVPAVSVPASTADAAPTEAPPASPESATPPTERPATPPIPAAPAPSAADVAAVRSTAITALAARRYDDAVAFLQKASHDVPGDASLRYDLGVALTLSGRHSDATIAFAEALRIDPTHVAARRDLARVAKRLAAEERARDLAWSAHRSREHFSAGRFALGGIETDRVLSARSSAPEALLLRGQAHLELGEPATARRYFLRSLAANPSNFDALRGVAESLEAEGDKTRAAYFFELAASSAPTAEDAVAASRQARQQRLP